jgi:glycerate dehydrogenase
MKLVVLDGYALNPGDLSWVALNALADCQIFDRTPEPEIVSRAKDATLVLTNKTPLNSETLESLPALRYIGVLATGYNIIDVDKAAQKGIVVTNVPLYGTDSVAQMVFALLLELCNGVGVHNDAVRQGEWTRSPDWSFWKQPLVELSGKKMGIVGYGRIGRKVAEIAQAFGMSVMVTGTKRPENLSPQIAWGSLDDMFAAADVVSLHCPLTPSTSGMVNSERVSRMKPSAFLINTSRGGLVVEQDLASALNSGKLAGAGLDVLKTEPPTDHSLLIGAKNCIVTPHIAWATRESRSRLLNTAVSNVAAWLSGRATNVVSAPK